MWARSGVAAKKTAAARDGVSLSLRPLGLGGPARPAADGVKHIQSFFISTFPDLDLVGRSAELTRRDGALKRSDTREFRRSLS